MTPRRVCHYCQAAVIASVCGECGLTCLDASAARSALDREFLSPEAQDAMLANVSKSAKRNAGHNRVTSDRGLLSRWVRKTLLEAALNG